MWYEVISTFEDRQYTCIRHPNGEHAAWVLDLHGVVVGKKWWFAEFSGVSAHLGYHRVHCGVAFIACPCYLSAEVARKSF